MVAMPILTNADIVVPGPRQGQWTYTDWLNLPDDIYYAEGHDGQDVLIIPSQKIVVVRLSVSRNGSWDMGEFLSDVLAAVEESK